MNKTSSNN